MRQFHAKTLTSQVKCSQLRNIIVLVKLIIMVKIEFFLKSSDFFCLNFLIYLNKVRHRDSKILNKRTVSVRKKNRRNNCRLFDFYVNFEDLGWNKWIIYPKSFNAFVCSGSCSIPLISRQGRFTKSKVQITNHAQIMSILEFKNPKIVKQMTKCVSTKLRPLNVMFLDERGLIKTKRYDDMIVEECGCR